jgi:hypothetical protein
MWALGRASNASSNVVARTLAVSELGQPPPNRFEPQARQNVFELPSAGWNVCSSSSPSRIRIDEEGTRPFTVAAPPDSFLQLSQWQYLSVSGASVSSNFTPPQRQLPRKAAMSGSLTRALPTLGVIESDREPVGLARGGLIVSLVVTVLLVAAVYETAVALKWISMGSEPGTGASGEGVVVTAAMLALLSAVGYFAGRLLRREVTLPWAAPLIPVAAAVFMFARFHSFDPYYLPTLRRFSEDGGVADAWVYSLVACAPIVVAAIRFWPRTGSLAAAILLVASAGSVFAFGLGH